VHVLIADEDPAHRALFAALLKDWDFAVSCAADGSDAWQMLQRDHTVDLVILNCLMSQPDGFELCRKIKEDNSKDIYTILITGERSRADIAKVLVAGADDYLVTPLAPPDVTIHLRNAMRIIRLEADVDRFRRSSARPREHRPLDSPTGQTSEAGTGSSARQNKGGSIGPAPIDLDDLLERCSDDSEFLRRLLLKFKGKATEDLQHIEDSIRATDPEQAAFYAHSLKGAAANLSAHPLQKAASMMEHLVRSGDLTQAEGCLEQLRMEFDNCLDYINETSAEKADKV